MTSVDDTTDEEERRAGSRADRHIRLGVQALAWPLLSAGPTRYPLARVLRVAVRHRRAEQSFLPPAIAPAIRAVATSRARRLRVRREAESLHHAHQTPERRPGDRREVVRHGRGPRTVARRDAGPAAA